MDIISLYNNTDRVFLYSIWNMLWQLYWDIDIVVHHIVSWINIAFPARGIVKGGLGIFCRERGMRLYAGLCKNVLSLVVFFVGWIYNSWCTPRLWCAVKPQICGALNLKTYAFFVSFCSCLCGIFWSQVLMRVRMKMWLQQCRQAIL